MIAMEFAANLMWWFSRKVNLARVNPYADCCLVPTEYSGF